MSDVVEPQLYSPSVKECVGPVDLIVSCGDLPPEYLEFLISFLDVPMVHVVGNHCYVPHDFATKRHSPDAYPGAYDLNGHVAEYDGLILAGVEGSPLYNGGPHQYTEQQVAWNLIRLSPALLREKLMTGRYLDVLVTHAPPRGIHDNADIAHRGFEALTPFIQRFKPSLLLHGHTHRYDPMLPVRSRFGDTEVINVYGHALLELAQEEGSGAGIEGRSHRWRLMNTKQNEVINGQ